MSTSMVKYTRNKVKHLGIKVDHNKSKRKTEFLKEVVKNSSSRGPPNKVENIQVFTEIKCKQKLSIKVINIFRFNLQNKRKS